MDLGRGGQKNLALAAPVRDNACLFPPLLEAPDVHLSRLLRVFAHRRRKLAPGRLQSRYSKAPISLSGFMGFQLS